MNAKDKPVSAADLLDLGDDVVWEPVFKTPEEYREFEERFIEAVKPKMDELAWARALSVRDSMFRGPLRSLSPGRAEAFA